MGRRGPLVDINSVFLEEKIQKKGDPVFTDEVVSSLHVSCSQQGKVLK